MTREGDSPEHSRDRSAEDLNIGDRRFANPVLSLNVRVGQEFG